MKNKYFDRIKVLDSVLKFRDKYPNMVIDFNHDNMPRSCGCISIQYNTKNTFEGLQPLVYSGVVTYDTIMEIMNVVDKCHTAFITNNTTNA